MTPDQVEFLKSFQALYLTTSQKKKTTTFLLSFFSKWFKKYPEKDAFDDTTDIDEGSLSKTAKRKLDKEVKAAGAQRILIDAQEVSQQYTNCLCSLTILRIQFKKKVC